MPAPQFYKGRRMPLPPLGSAPPKDEDGASQSQSQQPAPTQLAPPTQLERPAECINRGPSPAFAVLCFTMDKMRSENAAARRTILMRFMDLWRKQVGNDLYPLIRLLLPDRDRERPVYNLKEAMLAKCYIEVLGLDKHGEAAQRLIKWKQPVEGQHGEGASGDFARVCFHEIQARSTLEEGTLSVNGVNSILDELARGRLKQSDIVPILRRINEKCTASQQEWIIRIILKDLRISIREKGVFSCFHPDAAALFNVCSDLKRVCWTLYKPEIRLEKEQTNIELFRCFLPQLCYRSPTSSHDAIAKLVGGPTNEFIMEEKLDGERIQLHMRGSGAEWFYCSRKAKDYTYLYGSNTTEGSLTQFLSGVFCDDVRNIVLDGEMMVWDPILEKYLAFGTLKTAAGDKLLDENSPRPCFKVFDILYLNDRCLTGRRLSERKRVLRSGRIFRDLDAYRGRIEFTDEQRGKTGQDIRAMLERVLEQKGEGIVVKKADSQYETNSRGADWVKVKPEYADQMGENLDLLVLGGWWGKGGRTGKISSLLLGLRVPQEDDGSGSTPQFVTFASVGSGMSYEDYEWILNKHRGHWKPFNRSSPPPWLKLGTIGVDDKPDVYIDPEKSFVMEVKASEIVPAIGNYGAGYTLRFPRCRFIFWDRESRDFPSSGERRDRDMWNCLSVDEFQELLQRPAKRYVDDENGTSRKRRKVAPKRKVELLTSFRGQKLLEEDVETSFLSNLTFFIPKDVPGHKKAELEALVHKHGAEYVQQQLADDSAIVISHDDKTPRIKAQIRKGNSIVRPEWIFESIKRRSPLPMLKEFLVVASKKDQGGRYYEKTLEQFNNLSLARDRTGSGIMASDDEDGEEADRPSSQAAPSPQSSPPPPSAADLKTAALAKEWGLGATTPVSQQSTLQSEDESDTGDERRALPNHDEDDEEEEEEEYSDDEHFAETSPALQSQKDGDAVDKPLFPVLEPGKTPDHPPMGESSDANAYDEDAIFYHLVFYIDTAENAETNGLGASNPPTAAHQRLSEAEELLRENGGRIVTDVMDPRLTHIIMDDDDSGRYVELMRKTSTPKLKHIVLPSWVIESVDEETLMNEDVHKPK